MTKPFDKTKPFTWNGRPATYLCDLNDDVIVAKVVLDSGVDSVLVFNRDGTAVGFTAPLVNTPVKHKRWVNIYTDGGVVYLSKSHADECADRRRIACVEVEFDDGEGL